MHDHCRHVAATERSTLHVHRRKRQCPAVVAQVCEPLEELVINVQAGTSPVVGDSDQNHARSAVTRQVIGKCADGPADLLEGAARQRLFALHEV